MGHQKWFVKAIRARLWIICPTGAETQEYARPAGVLHNRAFRCMMKSERGRQMDTNTRKHIAETIMAARLRKGWTVTEAAHRMGTGESNWSRWERAAATPRPLAMVQIGELLDLPADWATVQHPPITVASTDIDDRLDELVAEVREQRALVLQLLEELKGSRHDGHSEQTSPARRPGQPGGIDTRDGDPPDA